MIKLPKPNYTVTDDNHKYTILLPVGTTLGPLISVTKALGVIDKPALKGWAARMSADHFKTEILRLGAKAINAKELDRIHAESKAAHTKFAKDAADLGSACHNAFEAIILGKELETYPPELKEPIAAFKDWRLGPGSDIEIVDTETAVASLKYKAGGRLDAIGYSESRGGWGIVDYKTSSGFYGNEYAYQVGGGYALMVEEMFGIEVAWGEIIRFGKKPPYDSEGRPVVDMEICKQGFLHALGLIRCNEMKLIGLPSFVSAGKPAETTKPKGAKKASPVGF